MRSTKRRSGVIAALLTVSTISLVACGSSTTGPSAQTTPSASASAPEFPATITTSAGSVRIAKRPTAIVSLSATATEMLYAIGAGGQVKAVDEYSNYPSQAPKTKLSGLQPNVEALLAQKPDLVLVDADRSGLAKRLASVSVPVLVLPAAAKLDDVYSELSELGTATGHSAQAKDESGQIRTQLTKIAAGATKQAKAPTYYYELEPDYYSVTSTTFVGQLLNLIGLTSIADTAKGAAAAGGYPQLSAEFIIKANPDWIFLADTICCQATVKTVEKRPGWTTITAVTKQQIVPLSDDIASRWGPRIVDLLQTVAEAMAGKR
jgi:iron complex transport system substrate-binding protein